MVPTTGHVSDSMVSACSESTFCHEMQMAARFLQARHLGDIGKNSLSEICFIASCFAPWNSTEAFFKGAAFGAQQHGSKAPRLSSLSKNI